MTVRNAMLCGLLVACSKGGPVAQDTLTVQETLTAPMLASQVARVDIVPTFLRAMTGATVPSLTIQCDTYDKAGRELGAPCNWSSRATGILTVLSGVRTTTVTPVASGDPFQETWVVAGKANHRDSVRVRVTRFISIEIQPDNVRCDTIRCDAI